MMTSIIGILNVAAALVILLVGLFSAVNSMSHWTRHGIRTSWILMTVGAAGVLLGNEPWAAAVLHAGMALHALVDRRRRESIAGDRPLFRNLTHGGEK
jgi:hypothetical protein